MIFPNPDSCRSNLDRHIFLQRWIAGGGLTAGATKG